MSKGGALIIYVIFFIFVIFNSETIAVSEDIFLGSSPSSFFVSDSIKDIKTQVRNSTINQLNSELQSNLQISNFVKCKLIVDSLISEIDNQSSDKKSLSDSYYLIGVYYSFIQKNEQAVSFIELSIKYRESINLYDDRYSKALYNLGSIYGTLGNYKKHEDFVLRSLEIERKIYGNDSPMLISTYLSLMTAYIEFKDYDRSLEFSNLALDIADKSNSDINPYDLADLYNNIGVVYMYKVDFSKAKMYFDKAESIYKTNYLTKGANYINLMNSMALVYRELGVFDKSFEYFEKGISLALSSHSSLAYNLINSYATELGETGYVKKGDSLLKNALQQVVKSGEKSIEYYDLLSKYADYLREYNIDLERSIEYYDMCIKYLKQNPQNISLKEPVYTGYSLSLLKSGQYNESLKTIQMLLFEGDMKNNNIDLFKNQDITKINPDKKSLKILKIKYEILNSIYNKSGNLQALKASSNTAELIVALLEKVRLNISEEDSRLILGDMYKDSYFNAISDFYHLYSYTNDQLFLEKAFEYSEKSKVAGLLASTRELKATQLHIPSEIAVLEKNFQRDISQYNALIDEESVKSSPDLVKINKWKDDLYTTTRSRDSLIKVFENQFPEYYSIKYNTQVAGITDIPTIVGRNINYISYVISDSVLYAFVINRKHHNLFAIDIDSSFSKDIQQFRNLLSNPSQDGNSRNDFEAYKVIGFKIYNTLIKPLKPYFVSDKLLISPDNNLSYIPFESLPEKIDSGTEISYNKLSYMMNSFDISYTYSATYLAESTKNDYSFQNKTIAFAPHYLSPIDINSVMMSRQVENGFISDLPYARQEAEFVAEITKGKLYENEKARETVFKVESGKYDIIHLAMHTILNDKDPMYSTLIFSPEKDSINDNYLKTYEVYSVPLKAKMVFLSSCNTGTGLLYSGEGILSLARGFIYSGSQSVVMSMWEIEDKSGTEIVKLFYKYLKKGYSKSTSLKKARMAYLSNSDQLRSHPYFWSTLVIYGNNSPLYFPKLIILPVLLVVFIISMAIRIYVRYRKYS
jgi:CHAT domain-containing protein